MKYRIQNFEKTTPFLDNLLDITKSLEELLSSLKNIDDDWKTAFQTEWWELELISAILMDKEIDEISETGKQKISQALENMQAMIDTALN